LFWVLCKVILNSWPNFRMWTWITLCTRIFRRTSIIGRRICVMRLGLISTTIRICIVWSIVRISIIWWRSWWSWIRGRFIVVVMCFSLIISWIWVSRNYFSPTMIFMTLARFTIGWTVTYSSIFLFTLALSILAYIANTITTRWTWWRIRFFN
jgi:hypothetical protein